VAREQDVVARLDLPGEAHEEAGVDAHGCFSFFLRGGFGFSTGELKKRRPRPTEKKEKKEKNRSFFFHALLPLHPLFLSL
jgi:hypothetical protein